MNECIVTGNPGVYDNRHSIKRENYARKVEKEPNKKSESGNIIDSDFKTSALDFKNSVESFCWHIFL
jgi:hypothetical protein